MWPKRVHGDIIHYFNEKRGLEAKEVLNKYKKGKAFSYFCTKIYGNSSFSGPVILSTTYSSACVLTIEEKLYLSLMHKDFVGTALLRVSYSKYHLQFRICSGDNLVDNP